MLNDDQKGQRGTGMRSGRRPHRYPWIFWSKCVEHFGRAILLSYSDSNSIGSKWNGKEDFVYFAFRKVFRKVLGVRRQSLLQCWNLSPLHFSIPFIFISRSGRSVASDRLIVIVVPVDLIYLIGRQTKRSNRTSTLSIWLSFDYDLLMKRLIKPRLWEGNIIWSRRKIPHSARPTVSLIIFARSGGKSLR